MDNNIIQCIICGAIPLLAIPINLIICKYRIFKEIQEIKSNEEIKNGYECKVCGAHFELNKKDKYVVMLDPGKNKPFKTYDCYDCSKCGCQIIANERKEGLRIDEQGEADTDEHL